MSKEEKILYFFENKRYHKISFNDKGEFIKHLERLARKRPQILKIEGGSFNFYFVGILSVGPYLISVLPKYLIIVKNGLEQEEDIEQNELEARKLVSLLRSYRNHVELGHLDYLSNNLEEENYSEVALAEVLLNNYVRYGIWTKEEYSHTTRGNGPQNWSRTVELSFPIISGQAVFYPEVHTRSIFTHFEHIITHVHQWATRYCIQRYAFLFEEYENIVYEGDTPERLEDLGSVNYLLTILESELRRVYLDVEIRLLKSLIWLVQSKNTPAAKPEILLYGTCTFYRVWEEACKKAFKNMSATTGFNDVFESPVWTSITGGNYNTLSKDIYQNRKNILIPDIIWYADGKLLILDAKYYSVTITNGRVRNNPRIGDITKQLLYRKILTHSDKSVAKGSHHIFNAFIFPRMNKHEKLFDSLGTQRWIWGYIDSKIPGFQLKDNFPIFILFVPPNIILDCLRYNRNIENFQDVVGYLFDFSYEVVVKNPI